MKLHKTNLQDCFFQYTYQRQLHYFNLLQKANAIDYQTYTYVIRTTVKIQRLETHYTSNEMK